MFVGRRNGSWGCERFTILGLVIGAVGLLSRAVRVIKDVCPSSRFLCRFSGCSRSVMKILICKIVRLSKVIRIRFIEDK